MTDVKMSGWWWLSFADSDKPKGSQFLGVVIVQGTSIESAAMEAHAVNANPGGQVLGVPIPESILDSIPVPDRNRLLTKDEAKWLDKTMKAKP